jgi:hypothetical protein
VLAALPEDAKSPGLDGAIATAEFFLTLYAPMFQSGDTRLWDALSGPECGYCADASENATKVADGDWTATGGEITPNVMTSRAATDGSNAAIVSLEADFADAYLAKSGSTPELQEAATHDKVYLRMILIDGTWLVDHVMIGEQ